MADEGVKITGAKETAAMFRKVEAFLKDKKPMENITEGVKEKILKLTAGGKDFQGKKFQKYSTKYEKRKGQSKVDLKLSGKMLGSLETKVLTPSHGRVFVKARGYAATRAKTDMLANIHTTGTGKQPRREFMNITPTGLKNIVKEHYDDEIMKILGRVK